jgi:hypothetical protein
MHADIRRNPTARFNALMGMAMAAIVVLGFSRTYYLKAWFETPPLTLRLHLHGLALTLWLVLFVVQASLVAAGRRSLHKTLGIVGAVLAAFIVAITFAAAIEAARLDGDHGGITAADRLYSSVLGISIFGLFVATGIALRKRPEIHKRLMLLATITVIGPGVTRAVVLLAGHGIRDSHLPVMSAFVLLALLYDWRTRGRPHWVLLSGGALTIGLQLTRRLVGGSETWAHIGNWLIQ